MNAPEETPVAPSETTEAAASAAPVEIPAGEPPAFPEEVPAVLADPPPAEDLLPAAADAPPVFADSAATEVSAPVEPPADGVPDLAGEGEAPAPNEAADAAAATAAAATDAAAKEERRHRGWRRSIRQLNEKLQRVREKEKQYRWSGWYAEVSIKRHFPGRFWPRRRHREAEKGAAAPGASPAAPAAPAVAPAEAASVAAAPDTVPDAAPAARVRSWRQRVRRIRWGIFHEDYNRQTPRARAAREMGAGLVWLIETFCLVVAWPFQRLFGRRADRNDGGQRPREPEERDGAVIRRPD